MASGFDLVGGVGHGANQQPPAQSGLSSHAWREW